MTQSTRALYAVGFAIALLSLGFGIFLQYDPFRLFLAIGGFALLAIITLNAIWDMVTYKELKTMPLAELEQKRPDLQIVKKARLDIPIDNDRLDFLPERVREFPLDCDFCNLLISPAMKQIVIGSKHYHEDCWGKQVEKNRKDVSLGKGRLDSV